MEFEKLELKIFMQYSKYEMLRISRKFSGTIFILYPCNIKCTVYVSNFPLFQTTKFETKSTWEFLCKCDNVCREECK